jgi:hypothetical protein
MLRAPVSSASIFSFCVFVRITLTPSEDSSGVFATAGWEAAKDDSAAGVANVTVIAGSAVQAAREKSRTRIMSINFLIRKLPPNESLAVHNFAIIDGGSPNLFDCPIH